MGRTSRHELRRMGFSEEDLEAAKITQDAQRRTGSPVLSIGAILGAVQPRRRSNLAQPVDLTERALRRRGTYDQAALLLDQQALQEGSPERATRARELAQGAKELSTAGRIEFDFFGGGNVSIASQYQAAITARLKQAAPTLAKRHEAIAVLWQIIGSLGWQSYQCTKTAADLCELMDMTPPHMASTLKLLEDVGAIRRVKRGRTKIITVTPEGAFRGNVNNHGQTVERYRLDVIQGGKADGSPQQ